MISRELRPLYGEEPELPQPVVDGGEDDAVVAKEEGVKVGNAAAEVEAAAVDVQLKCLRVFVFSV